MKKAGMCDPSLARKAKVLYFFAAGAAAMGAAMGAAIVAAELAIIGALPCKKALTQVVLETIAKWTQKELIATAAIKIGMPTVGFTTVHIFP